MSFSIASGSHALVSGAQVLRCITCIHPRKCGIRPGFGGKIPHMPELLDQVRDVLRMKHYSIRTEQAYVNWIKRYIFFHNKQHPEDMRKAEIRAFISELASKKSVAASTQTVTLSAATLSAYPC